ncbi:hypothetical protein [Geodermatophilus chilensis]|uniref:hypothetical protein n=1 Tax=Geodermatophilus chilensis TaxID=2035835 RepID=UPI000C267E0B|nr:hypothetical protein [Geodermatophilus chilensis]
MTARSAHRTTMRTLLNATADVLGDLDLAPKTLSVNAYDVYADTGWMVNVGLSNVVEVNDLADRLSLADDDAETANYNRQGVATLDDVRATVIVYTGRPDDDAEVTR